jgi:hypothetical protein
MEGEWLRLGREYEIMEGEGKVQVGGEVQFGDIEIKGTLITL